MLSHGTGPTNLAHQSTFEDTPTLRPEAMLIPGRFLGAACRAEVLVVGESHYGTHLRLMLCVDEGIKIRTRNFHENHDVLALVCRVLTVTDRCPDDEMYESVISSGSVQNRLMARSILVV